MRCYNTEVLVQRDKHRGGGGGSAVLQEPRPALTAMPFDPGVLAAIHVGRHETDTDAEDLLSRRTWKGTSQVMVDLALVRCIDLTTLTGADTGGRVDRLCHRALEPVPAEILRALGLSELPLTVGAVCVYAAQVPEAVRIIKGRIPIAAVSTDFPHGQNSPLEARCVQIRDAVAAGATEIDVVIRRELALTGRWRELYDELVAMREACGAAHLKVILGTGDLVDYEVIAKASCIAMMAGADFIKTSTGMESVNATFPVGLVMIRMIRWFVTEVCPCRMVGFKPAGGIRTTGQARSWFTLMHEELSSIGYIWTTPELFRLGASALLDDLVAQLTANAEGGGDHYADRVRIPLG